MILLRQVLRQARDGPSRPLDEVARDVVASASQTAVRSKVASQGGGWPKSFECSTPAGFEPASIECAASFRNLPETAVGTTLEELHRGSINSPYREALSPSRPLTAGGDGLSPVVLQEVGDAVRVLMVAPELLHDRASPMAADRNLEMAIDRAFGRAEAAVPPPAESSSVWASVRRRMSGGPPGGGMRRPSLLRSGRTRRGAEGEDATRLESCTSLDSLPAAPLPPMGQLVEMQSPPMLQSPSLLLEEALAARGARRDGTLGAMRHASVATIGSEVDERPAVLQLQSVSCVMDDEQDVQRPMPRAQPLPPTHANSGVRCDGRRGSAAWRPTAFTQFDDESVDGLPCSSACGAAGAGSATRGRGKEGLVAAAGAVVAQVRRGSSALLRGASCGGGGGPGSPGQSATPRRGWQELEAIAGSGRYEGDDVLVE